MIQANVMFFYLSQRCKEHRDFIGKICLDHYKHVCPFKLINGSRKDAKKDKGKGQGSRKDAKTLRLMDKSSGSREEIKH
jgi:hypothetical protein